MSTCSAPIAFLRCAFVHEDPPHPAAVLRRFLGGATALAALALTFVFLETGSVEWRLVALISVFMAALGFASDVLNATGAVLRLILEGGAGLTPREEAEFLERRLESDPPSDKEVLWGVRLAELYRRHLNDAPRSAALLDRLATRYPDSPVVRHAQSLAGGLPRQGRTDD